MHPVVPLYALNSKLATSLQPVELKDSSRGEGEHVSRNALENELLPPVVLGVFFFSAMFDGECQPSDSTSRIL